VWRRTNSFIQKAEQVSGNHGEAVLMPLLSSTSSLANKKCCFPEVAELGELLVFRRQKVQSCQGSHFQQRNFPQTFSRLTCLAFPHVLEIRDLFSPLSPLEAMAGWGGVNGGALKWKELSQWYPTFASERSDYAV